MRIRLSLHLVLFVHPTLQLGVVMAPVGLGPVLGQPLASLYDAVVLRSPRRIPDHLDAQADQPQGQRGRQITTRSPGVTVIKTHRQRSPPLLKTKAQIVLYLSRRHLGEVALGKKPDYAARPPSIHRRSAARKPCRHWRGVFDQRHQLARYREDARLVAKVPAAVGRQVLEQGRAAATSVGWSAPTAIRTGDPFASARLGCGRHPNADVDAATRRWSPAPAGVRADEVHRRDSGAAKQLGD